ncbi:hypothetical protein ACIQ62_29480 [Streptomyces sp. NPDC096319]|uniref:hypothetical protein n=1 Tax=Streptomyces sp. NPDC096319 TaxID=3366084 RepID=UPI00381CF70B
MKRCTASSSTIHTSSVACPACWGFPSRTHAGDPDIGAILIVIEQRGLAVSEAVRERVASCDDPDVLRRWLVRAVTVASAEEIFAENEA